MATLEEEKKKAQGFNRTFNAATDDPMNVSRARAANPLMGGAQNYDPATVGQPEPTGAEGSVWKKAGAAIMYSDDRAAIAAKNAAKQPAVAAPITPAQAAAAVADTPVYGPDANASKETNANILVPQKPATITAQNVGNQPVNSYDGAANNESLAGANAIRQQMIDAQPRGGSSILGGLDAQGRTRQEQENDEKTARWRQDELMQKARYAPQVVAGAVQGDAQQGVEETRQQGIMAGVGTQRRGQDIQAQTEAARIAGNPADNSLKAAQAQLAGINVNRAQAEAGLLAEAQDPNTPPERRKALITSLLAAQGKSPNENRYIPTTEKIYESGMVTGERARVFDKEAGKFADADQQQGQAKRPGSYDDYAKQVRAANPGRTISDAELKARYDAKYGAQ